VARGELMKKLLASYGREDQFRAVAEQIIGDRERKRTRFWRAVCARHWKILDRFHRPKGLHHSFHFRMRQASSFSVSSRAVRLKISRCPPKTFASSPDCFANFVGRIKSNSMDFLSDPSCSFAVLQDAGKLYVLRFLPTNLDFRFLWFN